tara:strand:+ start:151 stop:897 length:747 start_codon:yes stop_codon:yes gene_type:complete
MILKVQRTQLGSDATNGELFIDNVRECFTLEDEVRDGPKVYGETAVPAGEYEITLRTVGGFHTRTKKHYDNKRGFGPGWHQGMLWVRNIPGFQFILIHPGNDQFDTLGCLLVGQTQQDLDKNKDGFIGQSRAAYESLYPKVRDALLAGEKVTIKYTNLGQVDSKLVNDKIVRKEEHLLNKGDNGLNVKFLQNILLSWDSGCLPKFGADSDFGGETLEAIKSFQSSQGLQPSGSIDFMTAIALSKYVKE